jgi:hypothetical protein
VSENKAQRFTITAVAANWTAEERARRLAAAYKILLDAATKHERQAAVNAAVSERQGGGDD